jgi:hypothetical protein
MKHIKLFEAFVSKGERGLLYPLSDGGKKTLVLLPGSGQDGGQGDADFQKLADDLGDSFSVYTANFSNVFDVRDYARKIADEMETNANIKTCAVGGFSIGGAIAWHLAMALKAMGSKKFNNQLFFIDSGIPNSTEEFAEGIVKGNTPRIAMAQPLNVFIKNRAGGGDITPEEEKQILHFYNDEELKTFKLRNDVKDNYLAYMGSKFPPSTTQIKRESKGNNPWIIEDKYDKTNFKTRYSVKPPEVEGMLFKEGDVINNRKFVEQDTLKKYGLGRELTPGKISKDVLPKLKGVEVISLVASNKEGKPKSRRDLIVNAEEAQSSTTGESKVILISAEHRNITKSPSLATEIAINFK